MLIGVVNSGKSTFCNKILGMVLMPVDKLSETFFRSFVKVSNKYQAITLQKDDEELQTFGSLDDLKDTMKKFKRKSWESKTQIEQIKIKIPRGLLTKCLLNFDFTLIDLPGIDDQIKDENFKQKQKRN